VIDVLKGDVVYRDDRKVQLQEGPLILGQREEAHRIGPVDDARAGPDDGLTRVGVGDDQPCREQPGHSGDVLTVGETGLEIRQVLRAGDADDAQPGRPGCYIGRGVWAVEGQNSAIGLPAASQNHNGGGQQRFRWRVGHGKSVHIILLWFEPLTCPTVRNH